MRKIKNFPEKSPRKKGKVGTTFEKGSTKIAFAKNVGKKASLKLVKYPDKSGIIKAFVSTTCCNDPTRH